jgi:hypothetical protein
VIDNSPSSCSTTSSASLSGSKVRRRTRFNAEDAEGAEKKE